MVATVLVAVLPSAERLSVAAISLSEEKAAQIATMLALSGGCTRPLPEFKDGGLGLINRGLMRAAH